MGQRQLFLDDVGLAKTEGLYRTMHRPAKKGAVIRPDVSAGETCLQTRMAPFWDPVAGAYMLMVRCSVYASADGLHWKKTPVDQKQVLYMVLYDTTESDPNARYKGFSPRTKEFQEGLQPAVSPDLQTWRDGFVSLDADEREGILVTEPFAWTGNRLRVNLDAPQGELRAEVLDRQSQMLAVSAPLSGGLPEGEVRWREGSLAGAQGQVASLRFTLRRARFYSYWME